MSSLLHLPMAIHVPRCLADRLQLGCNSASQQGHGYPRILSRPPFCGISRRKLWPDSLWIVGVANIQQPWPGIQLPAKELVTGAASDANEGNNMWHSGCPQSAAEFEMLVQDYVDRLFRYAYRRLGSRQDAEDVVQDVFLRTFASRARLRNTSLMGPYLYRSVANACVDVLRKKRRSPLSHTQPVGGNVAQCGQPARSSSSGR